MNLADAETIFVQNKNREPSTFHGSAALFQVQRVKRRVLSVTALPQDTGLSVVLMFVPFIVF